MDNDYNEINEDVPIDDDPPQMPLEVVLPCMKSPVSWERKRLLLLLHAHNCLRYRGRNTIWQCTQPYCPVIKGVLDHMDSCQAGESCTTARCSTSREILQHWQQCFRADCPVCSLSSQPLRKYWHSSITEAQRAHIIDMLAQRFSCIDAKNMEGELFKSASTLDEYYRLLASKAWQVELDLQDQDQLPDGYRNELLHTNDEHVSKALEDIYDNVILQVLSRETISFLSTDPVY